MLIPRINLRRALGVMAVAGIFFAVSAPASRGSSWATAISSGILGLFLVFALHAISYWFCTIITAVTPQSQPREQSLGPFASNRMPPQQLQPKNQEGDS